MSRTKIQLSHGFDDIICLDNLLSAWKEFIVGKRNRKDVQKFQFNLMDNILSLYHDLANYKYEHGGYYAFNISDPKPRNIHKASVRDRLVHHAVYRRLYPFFDKTFIFDSYSCRLNKGTHKAINRFISFAYKASKNNTRTCWILKGDIRKFFASIDHEILMEILSKKVADRNVLWLIKEIVGSFNSGQSGMGLPLGNLTSQLLVNIYMNEFDQFVKHGLKIKYYIRYADDFVALSDNRDYLERQLVFMDKFLSDRLKLKLHPNKVFVKTLNSGLDFLGWVNFFDHRVLRTKTKNRIIMRAGRSPSVKSISSYLGLIKHGNTFKIKNRINHFLSNPSYNAKIYLYS